MTDKTKTKKLEPAQQMVLFHQYLDAFIKGDLTVVEYTAREAALHMGYAWEDMLPADKKEVLALVGEVFAESNRKFEANQKAKQVVDPKKPHSKNAGFVKEKPCTGDCGGWIVLYDRKNDCDIDAEFRWIVMHEPSSTHLAFPTRKSADWAFKMATTDPDKTFGVSIKELKSDYS